MSERFITMEGKKLVLAGEALEVGAKAPDFKLLDNGLSAVTLQDYGAKVKLVSVVPSLDTGVCDQQTRRFNEAASSLDNTVVITVSVDLPFAQGRWCGAAGLDGVATLSDHFDVSFGNAYGVLLPELRLLARAVFVLTADNKVAYVEYVPELTNHPNYNEALQVLQSFSK